MILPVRALGLLAATMMTIGGCCVNRPFCATGACDPGPVATGGCASGCCGPLAGAVGNALSCGAGCGEIYVDEWVSDPPDCCDPCDNCGNWVGPRQCCRPLSFLNPCNWFGVRYHDDCGGCGTCSACLPACDSCGGGGCDSCGHSGGEYLETIESTRPALPTPPTPPAPTTARTKAPQRPYYTRSASSRSVMR